MGIMEEEFAIKLSDIKDVDDKIFSILKESVKAVCDNRPVDSVQFLHNEILRREKE